MRKGKDGYTIVEVMIFLAVSTALFVMIAGTFSGRQAGAEFSTGARDMESRLQDIANDVSTGFYNNPGNIQCRVVGNAPNIISGSNQQGTNDACIFIGRVAQFDLAGSNGRQYNLYSVAGRRQVTIGAQSRDVESFNEAQPRAIATPSPSSSVDLTQQQQMPVGLIIRSMWSVDAGGSRTRIRAVGFFTTFSTASSDPSALTINVVPLGFPPTGNQKSDIITAVTNLNNSSTINPPGGVVVCMDGDNTNQYALLKIGGNRGDLATDLTIERNTCASAGY